MTEVIGYNQFRSDRLYYFNPVDGDGYKWNTPFSGVWIDPGSKFPETSTRAFFDCGGQEVEFRIHHGLWWRAEYDSNQPNGRIRFPKYLYKIYDITDENYEE